MVDSSATIMWTLFSGPPIVKLTNRSSDPWRGSPLTSSLDVNLSLMDEKLYMVRPLLSSQIEISAKISLYGGIREREFFLHIKHAVRVKLDVLKDLRSNMESLAV